MEGLPVHFGPVIETGGRNPNRFEALAIWRTALLEYRAEDHDSQAARDPWTIFDNNDAWRLQPLVAEGKLRSLLAALGIDHRNDDDFATSGFFLRTNVTHGPSGELVRPGYVTPVATSPMVFDEQFTAGLIDARVYRPVGSNATLSFRLVGGGALSDHGLPPLFQHPLGGAGSLPGYSSFSADCGARSFPVAVEAEGPTFFPSYGCDRFALFSAEYRGGFDIHFGSVDVWDDDDWGWDLDAHPNWVVFFDAGRGWAHDEAKQRGAFDTETLYDVGAGILLGDLGLYTAIPLAGEDRDLRFFIRVGPRF